MKVLFEVLACSADDDSAVYVKHSWIQIMALDYTAKIDLHQAKMKYKGGEFIFGGVGEWQWRRESKYIFADKISGDVLRMWLNDFKWGNKDF